MNEKRTVFLNAAIVTNDGHDTIMEKGFLVVNGSRIESLGTMKDFQRDGLFDLAVDLQDRIILPGILNGHTHVMGHMYKGIIEDASFENDFKKYIIPMEAFLDEEKAYWISLMGCIEALKFGSILINDLYRFSAATARAVQDLGMRAIIAHRVYDLQSLLHVKDLRYERNYGEGIRRLKENEKLIQEWHNAAGGRIRCCVGIHAPDTNSLDLMKAGKRLAGENGVGIHIHVAQFPNEVQYIRESYGKTPVELLYDAGILADDVICVHLIFTTERDRELLAEKGAVMVHCPEFMSVLGLYPELRPIMHSGIKVILGSDWVNYNPWQEMRGAIKLSRVVTGDMELLNAQKAFKMMTLESARAFKLDNELGSLEAGKKADFLVIKKKSSNLVPMKEIIPNLVYNMTGNEIEKVYIDGRAVMEEGKALLVDEEEVMERVQGICRDIWNKVGF